MALLRDHQHAILSLLEDAAMKVRCVELGEVFGDYVERWSTAIDAGRTTYQDETARMIERLRCQLGREAAEASLLLTDVAWTRRP